MKADIRLFNQNFINEEEYIGEVYEDEEGDQWPIVWIGYFEQEGEQLKPCFIKTYLKTYTIDKMFVAAGEVKEDEQGFYYGLQEEEFNSVVVEGPVYTVKTNARYVIENKPNVYVENGHEYKGAEGDQFMPINLVDESGEQIACALCYNCIPGYHCRLKDLGEGKQEIETLPIRNSLVKERYIDASYISQRCTYISAKEIVVYDRSVIGGRYIDEQGNLQRPKIAFMYDYKDEEVDSKGVLKSEVSKKVNAVIMKDMSGFKIVGSIPVYHMKDGQPELEKVAKLRYLEKRYLVNCTLEDGEESDYFWFYDCELVECENTMQYYKQLKTVTQVVERRGKCVGRRGLVGIEYTNDTTTGTTKINLESYDELYSYLTSTHGYVTAVTANSATSVGVVIPAFESGWKEGVIDGTQSGIEGKMIEVQVGGSDVYYSEGAQTNGVQNSRSQVGNSGSNKCMILMKKISAPTDEKPIGEVEMRLIYLSDDGKGEYSLYNGVGTGETKYYKDTFYGFLYTDILKPEYLRGYLRGEIDLNEILNKINKLVMDSGKMTISNQESYVPEDLTKLTNKTEKNGYLDIVGKIWNRIPMNEEFIAEYIHLMNRIYTFESTRMPNYTVSGTAASGLDKNHADSVVKVEDASGKSIEVGDITYNYKQNEYMWNEDVANSEHAKLLNRLKSEIEIMTNAGYKIKNETDATKVDGWREQIYKSGVEIVNATISYYTTVGTTTKYKVTVTMVDNAELEIYEDENVYEIFIATTGDENEEVIPTISLDVVKDETDPNNDVAGATFIKAFLAYIKGDIDTILGKTGNNVTDPTKYAVTEWGAFVNPVKNTADSTLYEQEQNRNELIEYSQMLSTIQSERDLMQKKGEKSYIMVKFQQTVKGTFFELLTGEKYNYNAQEQVYGYYISKGFADEDKNSSSQIIEGKRKGRKTGKPDGIHDINRYRITRMPEYYIGEPLDWRNDNYYCNQIYTLNADNLSIYHDEEYAARERTVWTKKGEGKAEQEMIGFFIVNTDSN